MITLVDGSDPSLTNVTLAMAPSSNAGDAAHGVLGSEADLGDGSKVVTVLTGWDSVRRGRPLGDQHRPVRLRVGDRP